MRFFFILIFFTGFFGLAQEQPKDSLKHNFDKVLAARAEDPLSPSRAAFYSAVLPGLGQIYNKSYWKLPLVYGALGTGVYFYIRNQNQYDEFREIYRLRQSGIRTDKYTGIDDERIVRAMRSVQKNRDLSILITAALYILNIVDANVDAHLQQFNVSDDLSFQPVYQFNDLDNSYTFGVKASYSF